MNKLLPLLLLPALAACAADNEAPLMSPLTDQHAVVGVELLMTVRGTDGDDDALSFSFASDEPSIDERARIETDGDSGLFRWVPMASDVGVHTFEFSVSDGGATTSETIAIDVALSGEGGTAPSFVKPLGTGTTLDVERDDCLSLSILVDDADTAGVEIGMASELNGADLEQLGELDASFRWCPSKAQIIDDDRYLVSFTAEDFDNPVVTKDYLNVFVGGLDDSCEGATPSVDHLPKNELSDDAHVVRAFIGDDLGLKHEPLLYYTFDDPGAAPDVTQMTQLTMDLDSGDMSAGQWTASIPSPVANQAPGSRQMAYYVIVAQDADAQGCSHFATAPGVGAFRMEFEKPNEEEQPPMCVDDALENDDNAASARLVDLDVGSFSASDNTICSLDDDWYEVLMYGGETLHAKLTFAQASAGEDIDILVYKDGDNLSGCSEAEPWLCDSANGQSATANETLAWPIADTGVYHLVVRGWDGAENDYDVCVGLLSSDCP